MKKAIFLLTGLILGAGLITAQSDIYGKAKLINQQPYS